MGRAHAWSRGAVSVTLSDRATALTTSLEAESHRMFRTFCLLLGFTITLPPVAAADRPNIVFIYADDLGFGDVGCNGAKAGLTPNVDRLAQQGLNFTDAHATSATCTP